MHATANNEGGTNHSCEMEVVSAHNLVDFLQQSGADVSPGICVGHRSIAAPELQGTWGQLECEAEF